MSLLRTLMTNSWTVARVDTISQLASLLEASLRTDLGNEEFAKFKTQLNLSSIEQAARLRYYQAAWVNVWAMPLALICYIAAILIIANIIYRQGVAILDQANMGLYDLFRF